MLRSPAEVDGFATAREPALIMVPATGTPDAPEGSPWERRTPVRPGLSTTCEVAVACEIRPHLMLKRSLQPGKHSDWPSRYSILSQKVLIAGRGFPQ